MDVTERNKSIPRFVLVSVCMGVALTGAVPASAQRKVVDACKLARAADVAELFGGGVKLEVDSATGPRAGTCDFSTETPKHIDVVLFYAPVANVEMYGFTNPPPVAKDTLVVFMRKIAGAL